MRRGAVENDDQVEVRFYGTRGLHIPKVRVDNERFGRSKRGPCFFQPFAASQVSTRRRTFAPSRLRRMASITLTRARPSEPRNPSQ